METRFFISDNSVIFTRQVFPRDAGKYKIISESNLDENQVFPRKKLEGKLVFMNKDDRDVFVGDYDYFNSFDVDQDKRCQELYIKMQVYCESGWNDYYTGSFSVGQGYFDKDGCRFEVKPITFDKYSCILKELDKKVNILDSPKTATSTLILPDFEYHICRDKDTFGTLNQLLSYCTTMRPAPLDDGNGNPVWKLLFMEDNGIDKIVVYFREREVVNCEGGIPVAPDGNGWVMALNDCAGSDTSTWVRLPTGTYPNPANNPDIMQGYCSGTSGLISTYPPPAVTVDVVMEDPVNRLSIYGWQQYRYYDTGLLKSKLQYTFKALNGHPGSTYAWTLTGGGTIISGAGGDTIVVQVDGDEGDIEIEVVETALCGDGATATHVMEARSPSLFPAPGDPDTILFRGPTHVCVDEQFTLEVPQVNLATGTVSGREYEWGIPAQFTIIAGGGNNDNFVTLQPKTSVSTTAITCNFRLTGPQTSNSGGFIYATNTIIASKHPVTDINIAPLSVCPSETGLTYSVWSRTGSTYEWTVIGGTIVSGQGTGSIVVDWGTGPTGQVIVKEIVDCGCTWLLLSDCEDYGGGIVGPSYYWCDAASILTFDDGSLLYDALNYMLESSACKLYNELRSDFFEWNPVGDAPGYAAGINYVTGNVNQVDLLTIAQKSDVLKPDASQSATRGEMTLKEMHTILATMFQVYWDVDDAGNFRYEHISFFTYPIGLDTTAAPYASQRQLRSMNKYDYKGEELPKYERFKWMEAKNRDFIGSEIRYESPCVNQTGQNDVKNYAVEQVTTDIQYIKENPEEISVEGWSIFANYYSPVGIEVITDLGALTGSSMVNAPLSWANLHRDYHRHNRYQPQGFMNGTLQTFFSFRPNVKQIPIAVKVCDCDILTFNPAYRVKTELGEVHLNAYGIIKKAEFLPKTNMLRLTIEYPY